MESVLALEIQTLKPGAPQPQVLTSTCLAEWASHFPAIGATRVPVERFLHSEAWGRTIVRPTRKYVPVEIWEDITNQLQQHVDFSKAASSLVFPVHADAGIGFLVLLRARSVPQLVGFHPIARARFPGDVFRS